MIRNLAAEIRVKEERLRKAYSDCKTNSNTRKIKFLLTYNVWLQIWVDSGYLEQRGRKSKQYCMARFNDEGPYAIGNVKIITNYQNAKEMLSHRVFTDLTRKKMSIANKARIAREGYPHLLAWHNRRRVSAA